MLFGNKNSRSTLTSNNRPEQRTNHGLIGKGIEWEFSSNNEIVVDGLNQVSLYNQILLECCIYIISC